MLPVEMIAKAINFLSTILVSTGLAGFGTKTGAAIAGTGTYSCRRAAWGVRKFPRNRERGQQDNGEGDARDTIQGCSMARIHWEKAACGRTSLGCFGCCRIRTWQESVFGKPARTQLPKCNRQLVTSVVNGLFLRYGGRPCLALVFGPLPGCNVFR